MKNYLKLFLLFVSILMGYGGLYAQGVTVSGTVTDASSGESLPGVTITLKGSTAIGTVSNADGNYSLTLPNSSGAVLQFSYLGFLTQSVPVQGKTAINVKLLQDTKALSEVVVTAYGTAKKANLTTAQIGVSEKQINETVNTTIEQAMQGRAAGVYITQNSGQPGGSISVNIRGVNSLTGTNEPLYV
ncbi:MAG: carboxypeptidase-like regulatory domain-containing protein, partial [Candidatus Azobacteroides sp.]|nr:carboxypeptidase-like regulatory domain-containing protein [Candidatus Azobacteroides sp.]